MKYNQSIAAFFFTLFFTTSLLANNFSELPGRQVTPLDHTMQAKLNLSHEQMQDVLQLNRAYWSSRERILNNPEKVGKNTALLACWDKWSQGLSSVLTNAQMQKFMQWQSQVDLLSETPY